MNLNKELNEANGLLDPVMFNALDKAAMYWQLAGLMEGEGGNWELNVMLL